LIGTAPLDEDTPGMAHSSSVMEVEGRSFSSVLVVDDDEIFLAAVARDRSRRMFTASRMDDALRIASDERPELVLIDYRLGGESGIQVVAALRKIDPEATIALCSSYLSIVVAVEAMRAGADDVIAKPFSVRDVIRRFESEGPELDLADTPTLAEIEWEHIMRVLDDCGGNISAAARRLGIYRSTLKRRLRRPMRPQ